MGSALVLTLAHIFVAFHESRLFDKTAKPGVYFQFVDDSFVIFTSELECDPNNSLNLLAIQPLELALSKPYRVLMICIKTKLGSELEKIKVLLIENRYPADVLLSCINHKLANFAVQEITLDW